MAASYISFGVQQLNRLFPFYILTDKELTITSFGNSISELCTLSEGQPFSDVFETSRLSTGAINAATISTLLNEAIELRYKGSPTLFLRGQVECLEEQKQFLFIATPVDHAESRKPQIHVNVKNDDRKIPEAQVMEAENTLLKFALKDDGIWYHSVAGKNGRQDVDPSVKSLHPDFEDLDFNKWVANIDSNDRDRILTVFSAFASGTIGEFTEVHKWKDNSGNYRFYSTRAFVAERDENNRPALIIGIISDIDAQKQMELRLKETANRLFFLIQNLDTAIVVEGRDRKILLVNERFCKLLGIKEPPEQLVGMNYTIATRQSKELYKNPQSVLTRIYQILEQKNLVLDELIELADGRFFKRDFVPIYLDGKYEGHLWQYADVTDQIIAEKKLEAQKQFYEHILNNIPADIATFNTNHEYLFVNPTAVNDPEIRKWMIGKKDVDYFKLINKAQPEVDNRLKVFNEVLTTKKLHIWEEKIIHTDGRPQYQVRNMYPVLNEKNEVEQIIMVGLDISDRKNIEDQLKVNEKRYRDLFNYSQAYICSHDLTGKILSVNPAICELLGFPQEQITGRMLTEFLPPEDVKGFYPDYLEKVINEGTVKGVFRILGKSGRKSFLLYKNFKVEEENSEPYIIAFSQDITDRIQAEKELLLTKKMTEEAHKAKETFLANMSHEIRTPMTGILGIVNLLSKTNLDEQQRKFTKLINESANNLLTIVNDVLDIEKITAGKLDLESIPFKLEDKVFTTLQSFQFKAEDKNINLLLNSTLPDELVVIGDPFRLSQILNNLLGNALKFTSDGDISVTLDYSQGENNSMRIDISVQDTGIGIRPDKINDIFNPFVQASSDTTRKYGGTGLGLTICKNLVEMQGGKISVASRENYGTTFSFFLTYQKGDISLLPMDHKEDINYKDLASIKILVAEDVELNQFLIKHILDSWGCEVTVVNNGKEAVAAVNKQYYDIVLMDIQMPEMDGITATKLIRGLNQGDGTGVESQPTKKVRSLNAKDKSNIPIIALTANALKGDGQRYLEVGMNGYITKPYTEEKLFSEISDVIKKSDQLRFKVNQVNKNTFDLMNEQRPVLYDLSMVNLIGKNDKAFTKKLVNIFLESTPKSLDHILKMAAKKDFDEVAKTAHTIKSNIDSMGIESLKKPIRELENAATDDKNTETQIETLNTVLTEVFAQLRELVEQ